MTKRLVRSFRGGRDDVADLDLLVGNDHPIDEQFHQPAFLLEGGNRESRFDLFAELHDRVGYPGKLGTLSGGGFELALLDEQGVGASL